MKILIVEDEQKTADYLFKGLTEQGCAVDLAANGVDGQYLAIENDYDVIVLDVMLPGQDGFAVLRNLRSLKQTPVIMLTARDRVEDRIKGLYDGADDYLIKPFSFLELLARLQALTRRGRTQEPTQLRIGDLQIDLIGRKAFRDGARIDRDRRNVERRPLPACRPWRRPAARRAGRSRRPGPSPWRSRRPSAVSRRACSCR